MGRVHRVDVGGMVFHALNRANFRSALFKREAHYEDFLALVAEGADVVPVRLLAYCLMPNHWHMALYPRADGDLSKFLPRIDPHAALSRPDPDGRIRPHLPGPIKEEVEQIRQAIKRSKPYGSEGWVSKTVAQFGLENTVRAPWRSGKGSGKGT